jgi:hypothetical protein
MTLPEALPMDHPRVEQFRLDMEDLFAKAFEEGVHVGILSANAQRAAAMILYGMGLPKNAFIALCDSAWEAMVEECKIAQALEDLEEGKGGKA